MAAKKKSGDPIREMALGLRKKEVVQLSFDPLRAKRVIVAALEQVLAKRDELIAKYPGFVIAELEALPEVCERVMQQQRAFGKEGVSEGKSGQAVAAALEWRGKLLPLAEALERTHQVSTRELARIQAGRGVTDNVQDVADLCELLAGQQKTVELVCGKGALATAKTAAAEALSALGVAPSTAKLRDAADLRDRYATLVVLGHDRLRAAAAALFGYRDAEHVVASLKSPGKSQSAPEPAPEPTPAPAPAT